MKTVYKYKLEAKQVQGIKMPKYAKVLCVKAIKDDIYIWVKVFSDEVEEYRTFYIYGTGEGIGARSLKYVGTAFIYGGELVFHVFEALKEL